MQPSIQKLNKYSTAKFYFANKPLDKIANKIDGLVTYIFAKNGVFMGIKTPAFTIFKSTNIAYKYFDKDLYEIPDNKIIVNFPKISLNVLLKILDVFEKYQHEVYCILYYNTVSSEFVIYFPIQKCTYASVNYDLSGCKYESDNRYIKCIDFHSHPEGLKSHSSIDTRDSLQTLCISCVVDVGNGILSTTFQFQVSIPILGTAVQVNENDIIDFTSFDKNNIILDYDHNRINRDNHLNKMPEINLTKNDIVQDLGLDYA